MKRPAFSDGEAGFALIETLVSAALLVVIAVALLTAAERAASTSLQSQGRSVAASIAEQDQERMRALPVTALSNYHPTSRTVPAGSGSYTVASRADWVRDSTGATQSCTNDTAQASYLKITSTVTSNVVGSTTKPLSLTSIVSPPVGAFASNQGTLAVKVLDSRDQPVVGMNVSITGARNLSDATNSSGCAVFAYIPATTYHVLLNQPGWVDPTNATSVDKTQAVTQGNVTVATVQYDRAAKVGVKFQTWNGSAVVDSQGWGIAATRVDTAGGTYFFEGGGTPQDQVDAISLWPAQTGYKFSSGDCPGAEPSLASNIPTWWTTAPGNANVLAPLPGTTDSVLKIRQPPLTMTVKNGATPLANATVVLTPADGACMKPTLVTGTDGKPTKAGGGAFDPGIPFGRYSVCVLGTVGGNLKKWTATNALNTTSATSNVVSGTSGSTGSLDLSSATTVPSTTTC
jgi:Tfp pilus assembly protein PilV